MKKALSMVLNGKRNWFLIPAFVALALCWTPQYANAANVEIGYVELTVSGETLEKILPLQVFMNGKNKRCRLGTVRKSQMKKVSDTEYTKTWRIKGNCASQFRDGEKFHIVARKRRNSNAPRLDDRACKSIDGGGHYVMNKDSENTLLVEAYHESVQSSVDYEYRNHVKIDCNGYE